MMGSSCSLLPTKVVEVSAKPIERKSILEEAAGISGIHARRQEAETRLNAAENN